LKLITDKQQYIKIGCVFYLKEELRLFDAVSIAGINVYSGCVNSVGQHMEQMLDLLRIIWNNYDKYENGVST